MALQAALYGPAMQMIASDFIGWLQGQAPTSGAFPSLVRHGEPGQPA